MAMLDDLRKTHDARPTDEERSWMDGDAVEGAARAMIVLGIAVMTGLILSYSATPQQIPHAVVSVLSAGP
jgi:hypothetical protein